MLQEPVYLLIAVLVTFLVTEGAKALAARFGTDIGPGVSQIIAALVGLLVMVVNPLLAQVPAEYAPYLVSAIQVILAVFSAFGVHRTAVRFGDRMTPSQKNISK